MTSATCAFCGTTAATAAMDMTGHGWRCASCQLRSQIAEASGKSNPMTEHLTRTEIEGVVKAGGREALAGVAVAIGGGVATMASFAAGGTIVIVFTGVIFAGLGMVGHGLHRRGAAKAALRNSPDARVVTR